MDFNENVAFPIMPKKATVRKGGPTKGLSKAKALGQHTNESLADNEESTIEQVYQKKTQLEHILLRPDTYIGSIEKEKQPMWVLDPDQNRIEQRVVTFAPGLYKIFDEIIVNASDNKQRDPSMDTLRVTIDQVTGALSVWNNGAGIPVVVHKEHGVYVPELIFGHLLTGSNFDDDKKKTTGGRNGYGAKLANIFSTRFTIETADKKSGKKFSQTFRENMTCREDPIVTTLSAKESEFTCVTFQPDLPRFKMESLDNDIIALLAKRAYDVAGCASMFSGKPLKVYLNGHRIAIGSFQQYLTLFRGLDPPVAFEKVNERWEVGVGISDGQFRQVSFVNGICTIKGGQHVNHVAEQITHKLMPAIKKKNKGQEVKGHQIRNHMTIYINALIENPAFDSQTKETLTTRSASFGSKCSLSDKLLKAIEKSGLVENVVNWAKYKQDEQLKRKGGSKHSRVLGITKLDDANFAGTARSSDCTLILTEGDSAKTLAISGLSVLGRDYYGVFPLKGKLLNVREAAYGQISKNEEIGHLTKIMGLSYKTDYSDTSKLRYGHLMIMTDQDHDGSHIKGLLINLLHQFWPSLLKMRGFLQEFITPIVKVSKGNTTQAFYTMPEYEQWKEDSGAGWTIKYYKGLGTSTAQEAKEYFSDLKTHRINFKWQDDMDGDTIDMAFAKSRVEDRKDWLRAFEKGTHVDYNVTSVSYQTFVNQELILFSMADNQRSIPCVMDGLKPAQRKVLFACFKRNLKKEIKVAQLAGYVSEHSAYHHGEASLNSTIIGMAQNFVGSNNINFLYPSGQFGTRLMGGKDAASPRYVFTCLEKVTRHLFHPQDDKLLSYHEEDGQRIEPEYYVPVIPTVLVNGSDGIGTGWSTTVPNYNPMDVIRNLRRMLAEEEPEELQPWYRGFVGSIDPKSGSKGHGSYHITGQWSRIDDVTVEVTELPVKKWTQDYKQFLESMTVGISDDKGAFVKDFKERHTDTSVHFIITLSDTACPELLVDNNALAKKLKLESSLSTSNMHLFDINAQIKKYDTAIDVLKEFFPVRLQLYVERREALLQALEEAWRRLNNRVRFILSVVDGNLVVNNRKKADLLQELYREGYERFVPGAEEDPEGELTDETEIARGYDYLLSMKIWSLTLEKVEELREQLREKELELEALREMTPSELWLRDLAELEEALAEFRNSLDDCGQAGSKASSSKAKAPVKARPVAASKPRAKNQSKTVPDKGASKASKPTVPTNERLSDDDLIVSLADRLGERMQMSVDRGEDDAADSQEDDIFAFEPSKANSVSAQAHANNKISIGAKRISKHSQQHGRSALFSPERHISPAGKRVRTVQQTLQAHGNVAPAPPKSKPAASADRPPATVIRSPMLPRSAPPRRAAAARPVVDLSEDESKEESEEEDDDSDFDPEQSDSSADEQQKRKKKSKAKSRPVVAPAPRPQPPVKAVARPGPAAAKPKAADQSVPAAKRTAPTLRKGKSESSGNDEEHQIDSGSDMPSVPRAAVPRRAAAAHKVTYTVDESEEEEEDESPSEADDDDSDYYGK